MNLTEIPSTAATTTLIRTRRSVFPTQYTGGKVKDSVIWEMLENANWAPTHGKTEPWRFVVFADQALTDLGKMQADSYKSRTTEETFKQQKYDKLINNHAAASHVIAIIMERQPSRKLPEDEEVAAVACAVQNMHLTATAHKVGAYWSSGGMTYDEKAREFFALNDGDKLLGFFFVGQVEGAWPEGTRSAITDKVSWVSEIEQ
jgi:nitroreductase